MSFPDPVDAIQAAALDGRTTGHDLGGFTRRIGKFGYRFVSRCRRCRQEVVVARHAGAWDYQAPPRTCPGTVGSTPAFPEPTES